MTTEERNSQIKKLINGYFALGKHSSQADYDWCVNGINALFQEDYWKQRCLLAEDILHAENEKDLFIDAWERYDAFKKANNEP